MFSVDLSTRECGGHVVVALRGGLDVADAAAVAARLAAVAASEPQIIVDLSGLEFIGSLLAAPRQLVLRVLAMTRLAGGFSVHATVEKAAASAGHPWPAAVPVPRRPGRMRWPGIGMRSRTPASRIAER